MTITGAPTIAVIDDVPSQAGLPSKIEWGPVIGGAIAAAALASVLHGFAAAIGLSVSSSAPTWRDASFALILLSGLYLLLVALASYAFGAYYRRAAANPAWRRPGHGRSTVGFRVP